MGGHAKDEESARQAAAAMGWGGEITFRYDPDAAAGADDRWRELMEKGGVVKRDGVVIGTFGPAEPEPECPWLVVAPYAGEDPWRTDARP